MIRKSTLNINYANDSKLKILDSIFEEYRIYVNTVINHLWFDQKFTGNFVSELPESTSWISQRLKQCAAKQALSIVKSQRKKAKKNKPVFSKDCMELDSRFVKILTESNSKQFDIWFKFGSIGKKIKLYVPSKKHFHFNGFLDWEIKKSIRLRKTNGNYFIDVFFKKDAPAIKTKGRTIGLDCGYKKLLIDSDGQIYDKNLEEIYNKISRKQQGSKTFKKSLIERDQKINESVKSIDLTDVKTLVVEDLKNVKSKSKGKIAKKFNNKLQRWSYAKVLNKLEMMCESLGVLMIRVDPAYSSQTCHVCNAIDKNSRNGEYFKCTACDASFDADHNAAKNILFRGLSANMVPVLKIQTKLF